jgi:hypothetical protein
MVSGSRQGDGSREPHDAGGERDAGEGEAELPDLIAMNGVPGARGADSLRLGVVTRAKSAGIHTVPDCVARCDRGDSSVGVLPCHARAQRLGVRAICK